MAKNDENRPQRVRRPSERIMLKTSFSNFTNTADDPVCLDLENNQTGNKQVDEKTKSGERLIRHSIRNKRQHIQDQYDRQAGNKDNTSGGQVIGEKRKEPDGGRVTQSGDMKSTLHINLMV